MFGFGEVTTLEYPYGMLVEGDNLPYPTTGGASVEDYLGSWFGHEGVPNATPEEIAALRMTGGQPTISQWIEQNKTAVFLGAGVLVLMAMMKGRR